MHIRTSPNQKTLMRPARTKGVIRSRHAHFSINGRSPQEQLRGFLTASFPGHDVDTYRVMYRVLGTWMVKHRTPYPPTPHQIISSGMFAGLI